MSAVESFRDAVCASGLQPPPVIEPGRFHRFPGGGKRQGNSAGWCKLFPDGNGGIYGDFSSGLVEMWQATRNRQESFVEREARMRAIADAKAEAEAVQKAAREEAKTRAISIWENAKPASDDHPYLRKKRVAAHGLRVHKGLLVVPMRDASGEIASLQFIDGDGNKRFLSGGQKVGTYHAIGRPNGHIVIAEGYATAASIYAATDIATAIAFDAGNLESVAASLKAKYPTTQIVVAADDDWKTSGNPGLTKAAEAAAAVDGLVAVPEFGPDRRESDTDFNDCAPDAIKRALSAARPPETPSPQTVAPVAAERDLASRFVTRSMQDIQAKPIRWLWPARIARGKVTLIAGHPGLGKSQLTAALAAVVSNGGRWPVDQTPCERGRVILLNAEDDAADTIKPRLEAAGADLGLCEVIDCVIDGYGPDGEAETRGFNLKADLKALSELLAQRQDVAMIVIDPVTAYLAGVDSHVNADVRALLAPLSEIAARHEVAIVCVSHLNKAGGGKSTPGEAMMRVSGSLAFVAAARAAFIVARDQENPDRRLFLPAKNNIAKDTNGLAFAIETHALPSGIETSRVMWEPHPVTATADEAMAAPPEDGERTMTTEAVELLEAVLADGKLNSREAKRAAQDAGISDKALRIAREKLRIEVVREGSGSTMKSFWKLPDSSFVPSEAIPALEKYGARIGHQGTNEAEQPPIEDFA